MITYYKWEGEMSFIQILDLGIAEINCPFVFCNVFKFHACILY